MCYPESSKFNNVPAEDGEFTTFCNIARCAKFMLNLVDHPKIDNFRRPSLQSSYYPIPHHSPARVPYKRATSSPLYLPTDKDYYPNNIIAQRCRRRRSTTPPFKEYKHFPSKFNHSHPPNVSYKIWSIPREVGIHLNKIY